jgi:CheY-like chemotaxis protein
MTKRVLDVGQCGFDHGSISRLITSNFDALVEQAHHAADALERIQANEYDLILINRLLDQDHSEGSQLLTLIKSDAAITATPVMLVTNFADHQQLAVAAGAVLGFGKAELHSEETLGKLREFLGN